MRIISNLTKPKKEVRYCGETLFLPPYVKWLAVDPNGDLYGYTQEESPSTTQFEWSVEDGDVHCICVVDLQDTGWKDTLVKV